MALIRCSECGRVLSNKAHKCPDCEYAPRGTCFGCRFFKSDFRSNSGVCGLTKDDYVREDKGMCPGAIQLHPYYMTRQPRF